MQIPPEEAEKILEEWYRDRVNYFMGKVMKATKGAADPKLARRCVEKAICEFWLSDYPKTEQGVKEYFTAQLKTLENG